MSRSGQGRRWGISSRSISSTLCSENVKIREAEQLMLRSKMQVNKNSLLFIMENRKVDHPIEGRKKRKQLKKRKKYYLN